MIARLAITSAIARRYSADPRTSLIGVEAAAAAAAAASTTASTAVGPGQRRLGLGDAPDRRRQRRDGDASVDDPVAVDRHDGGRPDDGDLHLSAVLETDVAGARSGGTAPARSSATSSSSGRADVEPGPVHSSSSSIERSPDADRRVAVAPKHRSGAPVSIAGDAFITLPPIVPCARVAWDPTIAEASASAVYRVRMLLARHDVAVGHERAEPEPAVGHVDRAETRRSGRSRRSRRATAPSPVVHRRRGPFLPRPVAPHRPWPTARRRPSPRR